MPDYNTLIPHFPAMKKVSTYGSELQDESDDLRIGSDRVRAVGANASGAAGRKVSADWVHSNLLKALRPYSTQRTTALRVCAHVLRFLIELPP